jgi:hypothetical protein
MVRGVAFMQLDSKPSQIRRTSQIRIAASYQHPAAGHELG